LKFAITITFATAMRKLHTFTRGSILKLVDTFYPPFRRLMPLQMFRYAACGGANMVFDILLYSFTYNFILRKQIVHIGSIAISAYIFAFIVAFCISFPTGFYLSRYVVWQQTTTKKRVQLFRYFIIVLLCILLNYVFLKLFIEQFNWWPIVAKIVTSIIVVAFSYFTQRNFSFKASELKKEEPSLPSA
jgi:putative flippase GtrA